MQMPTLPFAKEVVLIGGGHTHALFLRKWGMDPLPGARLTVLTPDATAPYTGMLPGFVAGHYGRDDLEIDIVRLARFAGARMVFGHGTGIDRDKKQIIVTGRPPLDYDFAGLDIGITSAMDELPGFTEHAIAAKPLGPFAARWSTHLAGEAGPVVVIGGGLAETSFRDQYMEWVMEGFHQRAWPVYVESPVEPGRKTTRFEWAIGGDAAGAMGMGYTARELYR